MTHMVKGGKVRLGDIKDKHHESQYHGLSRVDVLLSSGLVVARVATEEHAAICGLHTDLPDPETARDGYFRLVIHLT